MSTEIQPPLEDFAAWLRRSEHHVEHRLALMEQAEQILEGRKKTTTAEKIEQWRYQHLAEMAGSLGPDEIGLAEALDIAANSLAERPERAPRRLRAALAEVAIAEPDASSDDPVSRTAAALDPAVSLDELTRRAKQLTDDHFISPNTGKRRMRLYAPLYLSSHCVNYCLYCGFRYPNQIPRRHLQLDEAIAQAEILLKRKLHQILLVGGDFPKLTSTAYYCEVIAELCDRGIHPSLEIAPQSVASYAEMVKAGACGLTLFQETYNEALYTTYHPRGTKAIYDWRLEGLERAAEAGMGHLGLGALLGLDNPRRELLAMVRHAQYLQTRFPDRIVAFNLPRIREAPEDFHAPHLVDDEQFVRMFCALRLAFPTAELVLSTRESPVLRRRLANICITQMSAGSSTIPGGYRAEEDRSCGAQFPVCDERPVHEVATELETAGFDLVWNWG